MSCRPHRFGPGPWPARTGAGDADFVQDRLELRGVAALSGGEHNRHGLLPLLDGQVELGGQATARAAKAMVVRLDGDAAGRLGLQVPLFLAPAACWWARQTVEPALMSKLMSPLASAWACSWAKIRCQLPSRCQRRNRSYTRAHGPYRSGTSRHGTPVRVRNRTPSISRRLAQVGGRPGFLPPRNSGSSRAYCASVRSPRATSEIIPLQDLLSIHALGAEPRRSPNRRAGPTWDWGASMRADHPLRQPSAVPSPHRVPLCQPPKLCRCDGQL